MTCARFLSVAYQISAALPVSESRLERQLRSQGLVARCYLNLYDQTPVLQRQTAPTAEHLQKAANALKVAFRLQQRLIQSMSGESVSEMHDLWPMLHILNVEVALRRDDPNLQQVRLQY